MVFSIYVWEALGNIIVVLVLGTHRRTLRQRTAYVCSLSERLIEVYMLRDVHFDFARRTVSVLKLCDKTILFVCLMENFVGFWITIERCMISFCKKKLIWNKNEFLYVLYIILIAYGEKNGEKHFTCPMYNKRRQRNGVETTPCHKHYATFSEKKPSHYEVWKITPTLIVGENDPQHPNKSIINAKMEFTFPTTIYWTPIYKLTFNTIFLSL